ncbi:DUF4345 family protein [Zavarzinia aquatilis]|uniref:DUF4345 domain-containing protein n=1 Tax=Zavarzinia aquatilis TaxID=2211142 RepID=A0A317EBM8_9PROT|nr:DUF4345 family protein [Zavarzinia aquatilis]PWR22575.1 hypothetical protein DKG74_11925 [Zavarzinia aquatilis]
MEGYLLVTGALFILIGLRALIGPIGAVVRPFGLEADTPDALHYIRSGSGGVAIGCGIAMIVGGVLPAYALAGLVVGIAVLGGLVVGRLFSLIVDGRPGRIALISGGFEAFGLISGLYWLAAPAA